MTALETVLDRLDRVQRAGSNTVASCPVASHGKGNGDRNPSLSITEKEGRVLMHCMSGCLVDEILATIGLDFTDLWDEPLTKEEKVSEYVYLNRSGDPYFVAERWQSSKGKRFVQRLPQSEKPGLDGLQTTLYQLPRVLAAAAAHQPIWVVEGEKCVHAIETLGVVATTSPGGAAHWQDLFTDRLFGASVVNIVADNDDSGKKHAAMVMASCKQKGIPVRVWKVAVEGEKADIYDHVIAGKKIEDLIPLRLNPTKPEGVGPRRLLHTEYPPVTWVIPGMLPTGTAVLAGEPKSGKSLMTLDWGIGVASGKDTMHQVGTTQGSVLYLSLDNDSERRLQRRYNVMASGIRNAADLPIEFHTAWPTSTEAIAAVVEWAEIEEQEDRVPRLVVADTLTMIEPGWENGPGGQTGYSHTVRVMHRWNQLAQDLDVAIVFVHHTRKSQQNGSSNWKERILGSQGLSATINTILMLDNAKTEDNILHIAGRDVGAQDLEIRRDGLLWNCVELPHVDRPHLSVVRHT